MPAAALLLILLAPGAREPVGLAAWESDRNPLRRRISSLLVGEPVRRNLVEIVPLHARIPSEAGHGDEAAPQWAAQGVFARETDSGPGLFVRVHNQRKHAVFLAAGTILRSGRREIYVLRDAILPREFAALLPAVSNGLPVGAQHAAKGFRPAGQLPPIATGLLVHGAQAPIGAVLGPLVANHGSLNYTEAADRPEVDRLRVPLLKLCASWAGDANQTVVGAVFLIGGEVAGVQIYSTHDLFTAALPGLLSGIAVQGVSREMESGRVGSDSWRRLRALASLVDGRGRALAYLRGILKAEGEWTESYGEGFEVVFRDQRSRSVGHAVLDHRRRVVHAAFLDVRRYWRDPGQVARGTPSQPPRPPQVGGSEISPGRVDRKARPTVAEARARPRRPGPRAPSAPGQGGGGRAR